MTVPVVPPGYYDISFKEWSQLLSDDGILGPKVVTVLWRGARVLMQDVNGDLIVEHASGVKNTLPRIDRLRVAVQAKLVPVNICKEATS